MYGLDNVVVAEKVWSNCEMKKGLSSGSWWYFDEMVRAETLFVAAPRLSRPGNESARLQWSVHTSTAVFPRSPDETVSVSFTSRTIPDGLLYSAVKRDVLAY